MISSDRRPVSALLVVALLSATVSRPAHADGAEDDRRAVLLFEEGRKLAKDGRCADAIPLLQESVKRAPGVGALLNLGLCYQTAGKTATAHGWFKRAADLANARNDPRREEARSRARALEASLSTLTIVVPRVSRTADLTVRIDDATVAREQWDVATPIDPGSHVVEVRSSALPKQIETVIVRPNGDHARYLVPVPPPPPAAPASGDTERDRIPAGADSEGVGTARTLGFVVGGLGLGALVVGGVTGGLAFAARGDLRDRCPTYPKCDANDREQLDRLNDRQASLGDVSTISFVAAGVLLVTGVVLIIAGGR